MPELPEVETITQDLAKRLIGKEIVKTILHRKNLRYPIPKDLPKQINNYKIINVTRRAKYLLVEYKHGTMGIHFGMSGTIRVDKLGTKAIKHDHLEWYLKNLVLRYNDPRRFGQVFWTTNLDTCKQLNNAGIEPLNSEFTGKFLFDLSRNKIIPIKSLLMDSSKIAGIGNIYASECLFRAKVKPTRQAKKISRNEANLIVRHARQVLREAIKAGGSTLRDYKYGDNKLGYFQFAHRVYGQADKPCKLCKTNIKQIVISQRNSFYCPNCQK